jgi:hypothetical protein
MSPGHYSPCSSCGGEPRCFCRSTYRDTPAPKLVAPPPPRDPELTLREHAMRMDREVRELLDATRRRQKRADRIFVVMVGAVLAVVSTAIGTASWRASLARPEDKPELRCAGDVLVVYEAGEAVAHCVPE